MVHFPQHSSRIGYPRVHPTHPTPCYTHDFTGVPSEMARTFGVGPADPPFSAVNLEIPSYEKGFPAWGPGFRPQRLK